MYLDANIDSANRGATTKLREHKGFPSAAPGIYKVIRCTNMGGEAGRGPAPFSRVAAQLLHFVTQVKGKLGGGEGISRECQATVMEPNFEP